MTGDTADTLRPVIESIVAAGEEIGFILIDGSHETEGVRKDVEACLSYVPRRTPCVIVMHDSSNPKVRAGLLAAKLGRVAVTFRALTSISYRRSLRSGRHQGPKLGRASGCSPHS